MKYKLTVTDIQGKVFSKDVSSNEASVDLQRQIQSARPYEQPVTLLDSDGSLVAIPAEILRNCILEFKPVE